LWRQFGEKLMTGKMKVIGGLIFVLLLVSCTGTPASNDYYVSIQGNDSIGNGSSGKPWRTIQYALDHAMPYGTSTVRINLAKGIYNENILIDHEVIIRGVGSSQTVSTGSNPLVPAQNVSVIVRQAPANVPWWEARSVYAINAGEVHLENLNIFGGLVVSENSDFSLDNVIVYGVSGWSPDHDGIYGVKVIDSSFSINNSRIQTHTNHFSDVGFHIMGSSGFINNTYLGNGFDHVINVQLEPSDKASKIDAYHLPIPMQIYITGVSIEGSTIYWADGIRIQAPANVVIQDSKITRAPGGQMVSSGILHNPPYAGIEVSAYLVGGENEMRRVEILNNQISGFDVGIGINIETLELKAQGNTIQGITYGVQTFYKAYSDTSYPTVDFGGGPLNSKGKNTFSNQPKYAYYNESAPYLAWACYNYWNVPLNQVDPVRIFDKLDKPALGRVFWKCITKPSSTSVPPATLSSGTGSGGSSSLWAFPKTNTNCREGNNSSLFGVVELLLANNEYVPVGRGQDNQWLQFEAADGRTCWAYIGSIRLVRGVDIVDIEDVPETILAVVPYPVVPGPTPTATPKEQSDEVPTPVCLTRICP